MKTSHRLFLALTGTAAALTLSACTGYDTASSRTNAGPGGVAGPSSNWTSGSGGFSTVNRDSGSSIRGAGMGAGTSGSTGTAWIENSQR